MDAQTVRPLYQIRCIKCYCIVVLTGTDAQTVRPYKSLHTYQVITR